MQRLGVANKAIPSGHKLLDQFLENLLLGGPVEVDDDVATEDHVCLLSHPIVSVLEVQSPELD